MTDQELRDAAVSELLKTTLSGTQMTKRYGADWSKWPVGHWQNARGFLEQIGVTPPPVAPPWPTYPKPDVTGATVVTTASEFASAVASAKAGETIDVAAGVQIPGQFNGFQRVVPDGLVTVVFEPGAGFVGGGGDQYDAVWIRNAGGWYLWGGTVSNPTGGGIDVYALPGPFTWVAFTVGQVATTGVMIFPVGGDITNLTLAGLSGSSSQNLAWDPHTEKGTGFHAWNIADANNPGDGIVRDSLFVCDTADQATGAAVEVQADRCDTVTIWSRAKHLGFALPGTSWTGDAQTQVAGNVLQLWTNSGGTTPGPLTIKYAEGNNIQGRILETDGVQASADLTHVTVAYGAATGPILQNPRLSKIAYATKGGLQLEHCTPLP